MAFKFKSHSVLPGFGITLGYTLTYLSLIVLVPLSELAPQLIHPSLNVSISELLATVKDDKRIHMMGA